MLDVLTEYYPLMQDMRFMHDYDIMCMNMTMMCLRCCLWFMALEGKTYEGCISLCGLYMNL